jgi:hypothetical protein
METVQANCAKNSLEVIAAPMSARRQRMEAGIVNILRIVLPLPVTIITLGGHPTRLVLSLSALHELTTPSSPYTIDRSPNLWLVTVGRFG